MRTLRHPFRTSILVLIAATALVLIFAQSCSRNVTMTQPADVRQPLPKTTLQVTTWNIGYAGLDAGADFFADLGVQRRPLSGDLVDRNLAAITQRLAADPSDILLLQEVADPSYVTWRRDVARGVKDSLAPSAMFFTPDFRTTLVPPPWSFAVGPATISRVRAEVTRVPLSSRPDIYWGVARRDYAIHLARLDGPVRWSVINMHLSAFDEDGLREEQAREVLALAAKEHEAGRCVVLGGDWNLRLTQTSFAHQTDARFQFWLRDLPAGLVPAGWKLAIDPAVPTVRTLHQPYVAGQTYTTIVDGFVVSPGVEVISVAAVDLGFAHSDHNPVRLTVRASGCSG